ncbi:hypothetical protein [Stutzerimonas sp. VN223-3]
MNGSEPQPSEDQTPLEYDEYSDVPGSADTSDVDEREDQDESPLG